MAEKSANKKEKVKKDNAFKKFYQGRVVSSAFFRKHGFTITAIVAMFIISMAAKFQGRSLREDIIMLTHELNDAKSECVKYRSEYNSMIRETQMRNLIKDAGIDLEAPERPSYTIK